MNASKRLQTSSDSLKIQQRIRAAKKEAQDQIKKQRAVICTAENGYDAGKPEEYTYVPHYCALKKKKGQQRKVKVNKNGTISAADTRREIQILEKELDKVDISKEYEIDPSHFKATIQFFSSMIAPSMRVQHPNPLDRYDVIYQNASKIVPAFRPHRNVILSLVLENFRALI